MHGFTKAFGTTKAFLKTKLLDFYSFHTLSTTHRTSYDAYCELLPKFSIFLHKNSLNCFTGTWMKLTDKSFCARENSHQTYSSRMSLAAQPKHHLNHLSPNLLQKYSNDYPNILKLFKSPPHFSEKTITRKYFFSCKELRKHKKTRKKGTKLSGSVKICVAVLCIEVEATD